MAPARRTSALLWILLAGILLFFRIYQLHADPPPDFGIQFISDEGWWVHNARNQALFGNWILDEFNQSLFISPLYCLLVYVCYSAAGVGLASSRFVSALSGLLVTLVVGAHAARQGGRRHGLLAAAVIGANYSFICLNRVAFVDTFMLVFLCLAVFLSCGAAPKRMHLLMAGIAFGVALCTKSYSLVMTPVLLSCWYYDLRRHGRLGRRLEGTGVFLIGLAATLTTWFLLIYRPFAADFTLMYSLWSDGNLPHGPWQMIKNVVGLFTFASQDTITIRRFIALNPILLLLFWSETWRLLSGAYRNVFPLRVVNSSQPPVTPLPDYLAHAWIWLGWALLALLPLTAKPMRRYILLLPPLTLVITHLLASLPVRLPEIPRRSLRHTLRSLWLAIPLALLTTPPLARLLAPLAGRAAVTWGGGMKPPHLESITVLTAILTLAMWWPIACLISHRLRFLHRLNPTWMLILLLGLHLGRIVHLHTSATFSQYETSRYLRRYFQHGTRVLGGVADSLCLENEAFSFAIWGRQEAPRVLNERPVARYAPEFLMIVRKLDAPWPPEARYVQYAIPENLLDTLQLLPVRDTHRVIVDLYSLKGIAESSSVAANPLTPL
ncbi:glycosyltransferase family 39 protein [bacterium]|nr:glycosyltransferase family 39 protein [candidate division CSSED10-310 bacterium]